MTRKKTTIDYVKSSGNVFQDLGLPHPEPELLTARLTLADTLFHSAGVPVETR